jgi:hypothetical protein
MLKRFRVGGAVVDGLGEEIPAVEIGNPQGAVRGAYLMLESLLNGQNMLTTLVVGGGPLADVLDSGKSRVCFPKHLESSMMDSEGKAGKRCRCLSHKGPAKVVHVHARIKFTRKEWQQCKSHRHNFREIDNLALKRLDSQI